jgi:hypothetical protein
VEIDFNFVRAKVASNALKVCFISSHDQIADVLTKPIVSTRFHTLCSKSNMNPLPLNLREDVEDNDQSHSNSNDTKDLGTHLNSKV